MNVQTYSAFSKTANAAACQLARQAPDVATMNPAFTPRDPEQDLRGDARRQVGPRDVVKSCAFL